MLVAVGLPIGRYKLPSINCCRILLLRTLLPLSQLPPVTTPRIGQYSPRSPLHHPPWFYFIYTYKYVSNYRLLRSTRAVCHVAFDI